MDKLSKRRQIARWLAALCLLLLAANSGCSRRHYRHNADREVASILHQKDMFPAWKIENMHVYPDERARFADRFNPDRPPMPPDDPAAYMTAPNPQRPGRRGVAWEEGEGYLEMLAHWDSANRMLRGQKDMARVRPAAKSEVVLTAHLVEPDRKWEAPPPPRKDGEKQPFLVNIDQAVELGLINSREFQTRREDLYLAALPVTRERFSFNTQFFALSEALRHSAGSESRTGYGNFWQVDNTLGFSKLFSTGALLLAGFANSTVINLTGGDRRTTSTSVINLDFIQPLLQGGGRAVTLEPLTQVERNLLYEIRSYARFRKEFFQNVSAGGDLVSFGGTASFGSAAAPGSISLGTGNPAVLIVRPGAAGRIDLSRSGVPASEGYYGTLLRASQKENARKNVEALYRLLEEYRLYEKGDRISRLQVDQVELQWLDGRTRLEQTEVDLRDSSDRFKLQLGLPLTVPLELDDELLQPISEQLTGFEEIVVLTGNALKDIEVFGHPKDAGEFRKNVESLLLRGRLTQSTVQFKKTIEPRWNVAKGLNDKDLEARLLADTAQMKNLETAYRTLKKERDALERRPDRTPEEQKALLDLERRMQANQDTLDKLERETAVRQLEFGLRRYAEQPWLKLKLPDDRARMHSDRFREVRNPFGAVLREAVQERLELVKNGWAVLPPVTVAGFDITKRTADEAEESAYLEQAYQAAVSTALSNRLDLMNMRAQVVDSWRQLAVFANALLGAVNVGYHMDSITPPDQAKPLAFSGSRTRQQLFLNAELPLVRLAERNAYRASLIAYQRARRDLMALEDQIANQVRQEVRQLRLLAKTFENQKESMRLAYSTLESSQLTLFAPPDPRQLDNPAAQAALTTQLLQAYNRLPQTQNQLYSIWVNYHIFRQQFFLDLELMPLDSRGVWIDEHPRSNSPRSRPAEPERGAFEAGDDRRARLLPPETGRP